MNDEDLQSSMHDSPQAPIDPQAKERAWRAARKAFEEEFNQESEPQQATSSIDIQGLEGDS